MVGRRKEGECCFATNSRSYKVEPLCPFGRGSPGGNGSVGGGGGYRGWGGGFHLSLPGLLLPPAAASQPRAFPLPPDHIGLRGAEPPVATE